MSAPHLVKRFFGAVGAKELPGPDAAWVHEHLLPGERALWDRMSVADQVHAHGVAREVVGRLGEEATRPVVAAALLHDIGKVEAQVGTFGRVLATLAGQTATREQVEGWAAEDGWLGRMGRYLDHNNIGARLLEEAGADPLTVTWAREHELVHTEWTLPKHITDALWAADNG